MKTFPPKKFDPATIPLYTRMLLSLLSKHDFCIVSA